MTTARATFEVASWNESTYDEVVGGGKLTRASVEGTLTGDIRGESTVQWLMAYRSDGSASYVGLQRVTGSIGALDGSFVVDSAGAFADDAASGTWTVIEGMGTGGLRQLRGSGTFHAPHGSVATVVLEYEVD
jgi:hypothetical protein